MISVVWTFPGSTDLPNILEHFCMEIYNYCEKSTSMHSVSNGCPYNFHTKDFQVIVQTRAGGLPPISIHQEEMIQ